MAVNGIRPIQVLRGSLPRRAQSLVFEWPAMRQAELAHDWERAKAQEPLQQIEPLE
jgi:hypothetical protein